MRTLGLQSDIDDYWSWWVTRSQDSVRTSGAAPGAANGVKDG